MLRITCARSKGDAILGRPLSRFVVLLVLNNSKAKINASLHNALNSSALSSIDLYLFYHITFATFCAKPTLFEFKRSEFNKGTNSITKESCHSFFKFSSI